MFRMLSTTTSPPSWKYGVEIPDTLISGSLPRIHKLMAFFTGTYCGAAFFTVYYLHFFISKTVIPKSYHGSKTFLVTGTAFNSLTQHAGSSPAQASCHSYQCVTAAFQPPQPFSLEILDGMTAVSASHIVAVCCRIFNFASNLHL